MTTQPLTSSGHPIHWLYQQFVGAVPSGQASCYLCGVACPEEHTVAKGLADTFNSHYLARCPASPWLCAACQWYFDLKAGHPDFRKMSLIVSQKNWHNWQRADMKTEIGLWVSHGLEGDAYLVVSLSKKKHILLQAPLNNQGTRVLALQVEEQVAYVDQSTWQTMNRSFMRLIELGHNKGEILSGDLYSNTLRKHGQIKEAMQHSDMLTPYRNSSQLDLLSYVTIVDKEGTDNGSIETTPDSSTPTASSLQPDRPGVQIEVPGIDLGAGRKQRPSMQPNHEQLDLFS